MARLCRDCRAALARCNLIRNGSEPRESTVPRLSIVIPFENDPSRLESTLLSVLENRPEDIELILVHRGNYEDPYQLENDELIVVESDGSATSVELINEGVRAACASIVQILPPGCTVDEDWCEDVLDTFVDADVAAASVPLVSEDGNVRGWGLESVWLPRRSVCLKRRISSEVAPMLHGGFFRRRVLLALDGFYDDGSLESAECEFGIAIKTLGMRCEVVDSDDSYVVADDHVVVQPAPSYSLGYAAGRLAQAYAKHPASQVRIDSFVARIGHVAGGLMSPATVAERLGWALGVRDHSMVGHIEDRIGRAEQQLEAWRASQVTHTMRRAA